MKRFILLLCGTVLLTVGCSSNNANSYASYGEYGYVFDYVPQPIPGITVAEVQRMYGTTTVLPASAESGQAGPLPFVSATK